MMLRNTSELRRPLAKETVAVFASVGVSIANDVGIGVGDCQMAVHPLLVIDSIVD